MADVSPAPAARARLHILGAAVLWGTTGTAQALGPAGTSPVAVGASRIALGAIGLLVVAAAGGELAGAAATLRRAGRRGVTAAAGGIAAYQACFFAGVARTGVAVGTIVAIGSAPAFTGLLALAARGERPEPRWAPATALAVVGAALLVLTGADDAAGVDPGGVLLALGAGASYAVYTVASKQVLAAGCPPTGAMAAAFGGGALLLLPVLAVGDLGWLAQPRGLAMVAWLGLAATAVSYVLFARGLRDLTPPTVATLSLAEPLTAAVLGVALLAERPGPGAVAGAVLVLAGLVVLSAGSVLPSRRR